MVKMDSFGNKIKELRMAKGLSQRQLADIMMVSNGTIANWEVGKRLPDVRMIARLADCLDVEYYVLTDELCGPADTPRVIVVEDVPVTLKGLVRTMREEMPEAEIQGFSTGADALEYTRVNRVSVAFLDIELPGENGIDLAAHLKEIDARTNIVFLTCHPEYVWDALDAYCSGYILKPLTPEKLHRAIDNLRFPIRGLRA